MERIYEFLMGLAREQEFTRGGSCYAEHYLKTKEIESSKRKIAALIEKGANDSEIEKSIRNLNEITIKDAIYFEKQGEYEKEQCIEYLLGNPNNIYQIFYEADIQALEMPYSYEEFYMASCVIDANPDLLSFKKINENVRDIKKVTEIYLKRYEFLTKIAKEKGLEGIKTYLALQEKLPEHDILDLLTREILEISDINLSKSDVDLKVKIYRPRKGE